MWHARKAEFRLPQMPSGTPICFFFALWHTPFSSRFRPRGGMNGIGIAALHLAHRKNLISDEFSIRMRTRPQAESG